MKYPLLFIFVPLLSALLLFSGCVPEKEDESTGYKYDDDGLCDACLNSAPDPDDLSIDIPEDETKSKSKGEMAVYYHATVDMSRALNYWILAHLGWLDEILSYPPSNYDGEYCIWGPFIPSGLSPVEVKFLMRRSLANADSFDYYWKERPKNTTDEWTDIWGGDIVPSTTTARRGVGTLAIDYTAAYELDPTINATGLMLVNYDTYSDGRQIDITFDDWAFEWDGLELPIDAQYHYHNHADNTGEFEFTYFADFPMTGQNCSGAMETYTLLTEWLSSGQGASYVTISGGDFGDCEPEGFGSNVDSIVAYECWNDTFDRTYFEEKLILTNGTEIELTAPEGDPVTCAF